ncbi:hypothetical protein M218_15475 [Burkholderia pseudomallei MSHR338]|nr:hypothetical protein M218_15475 [Burkholderia pseudomallei MSHR338]
MFHVCVAQGCIEERYTLLVQVTRAHAFA